MLIKRSSAKAGNASCDKSAHADILVGPAIVELRRRIPGCGEHALPTGSDAVSGSTFFDMLAGLCACSSVQSRVWKKSAFPFGLGGRST
jgi:hypothetical protein